MHRFVLVVATLMSAVGADAAAQTVSVEGGAAGLEAAASSGRVTVSDGVGGGYVGGGVTFAIVHIGAYYSFGGN